MKEKRKFLLVPFVLVLLAVMMVLLSRLAHTPETLEGKGLLILGDSYSAGFGVESADQGWPWLTAQQCGMTLHNDAVSGSTLSLRGMDPMVQRCMYLPEGQFHVVIIQGGSNDWAMNTPLGALDSRDQETFLGALNCILEQMETQYPEAQLLCFSPWISTGDKNLLGMETTEYVEAMKDLCQARQILCYDASDAEANGIHMDDPVFRAEFCLDPQDRWHLNAQGQALFAEAFVPWLQENCCKN